MKIWIVSCFLAAILLAPWTKCLAQGRGTTRFDATQTIPKDIQHSTENLAKVDVPRNHRFDTGTRGLNRPSSVPLESRYSASRLREFSSHQDQTSTAISDINRRNGQDIRLSRNRGKNTNQNVNTNDFSGLTSGNRRNNLKEDYSSSRTSNRLRKKPDNLGVKATEVVERQSAARSKVTGRDFSARASKAKADDEETLSTRESEISERRSSRRGKNSVPVSLVGGSTEFPSRRQTLISDIQDTSQISRTRSRTVKNEPNEKLDSYRSEITTFPTRTTFRNLEEISLTDESTKINARARNLNSENSSKSPSSRSKSRASTVDADITRDRNVEGRTSQVEEGRQNSSRPKTVEEVRRNSRTRISESTIVPSSRSSTRSENHDSKRGNSRTRNENEFQSTIRSRNSEPSQVGLRNRPTSEDTQAPPRSSIRRGHSRSKETLNTSDGSKLSTNESVTANIKSRSEVSSRVRSRNENISRGSSRSRSEDTYKGNRRSKTGDENVNNEETIRGRGRSRNVDKIFRNEESYRENVMSKTGDENLRSKSGGSFNLRNKNVEAEQSLESSNPGRQRKEERVPQQENLESFSTEKINLQTESNVATVSTANQGEALAADINTEALNTQSETPIDVSSSSIGYEVQEATEPIYELSSTESVESVSNVETKSKDDVGTSSINKNTNSRSKGVIRSDHSRSRDSKFRNAEESIVSNGEKEVLRSRTEKENKRSRSRIKDLDTSTVRSSRGRHLKTDNLPVSNNSRRRKVPERSNVESRRSSDFGSQIDEVEGSRTLQRDSVETRISSRKKDLTPDQTEAIASSRLSSKGNIEKDIETSNSALRSIRFQGSKQERHGKENDQKLESKDISTSHSVEDTLNARRASRRNKVKDDSTNENETKTTKGRGSSKHTADGKRTDQVKTSAGKKSKDKNSDDDVDEDANYPLEFIQLKKAGKGPKDILALLMARKKQREAESKSSAIRSLPLVQKRIPLDLKTEEDQVRPSIESPLPSKQAPNPFRDLDPTLVNPPTTQSATETIDVPSSSVPSVLHETDSKQNDGIQKNKEKETESSLDFKTKDKQITENSDDENIKVKNYRRKSGKYSAQYRGSNLPRETTESSNIRSFKPNRYSAVARNPGRSQNELVLRDSEHEENEKVVATTPRFAPSSKTTNVPDVESTTAIKPRYQLYMAKDRKKLLDRRLGGNPTALGEDLNDAKGYTLGNVESSTEKDGRWKRLKFGAASRPPYNPPRKSTSQLPKFTTTTTPKSVSRFKSRKSTLLKRAGENEEIIFEGSEDDHDPVTIKYFDRIDLFSSPPPKLESANLLTEIVISTMASNLESLSTSSQRPTESPLLNTVFDGETITPATTAESTTIQTTSTKTAQSTMTVSPLTSSKQSASPLNNKNSVKQLTPLSTTKKPLTTTKKPLITTKRPLIITKKPLITTKSTITTTTIESTTAVSEKFLTLPLTTTNMTKTTTPTTTSVIRTTTPTRTTTTTKTTPTTTTATPTTIKIIPNTIKTTPTPTRITTIKTVLATARTTPATVIITPTVIKITPNKKKTTSTPNTTATTLITRTTPITTTTIRTTPTTIRIAPTTIKTKTTTPKTTTAKRLTTITKVKPNTRTATKKPTQTTTVKSIPISKPTVTPETTIKTTPTTSKPQRKITEKEKLTSKSTAPVRTTPAVTITQTKILENSSSERLLSRSYLIDESPSQTVAPRTTRTPSPFSLSSYPTEPTLDLSSGDYVVYGLLPNKTLVRRVPSRTTTPPSELPFVVYGLFPNGTIVKRFPNGTVIADDPLPQEANELVANVDPFNKQELSDIVERDRSLAYLYPTYSTMAPTTEKITTTTTATTTVKPTSTTIKTKTTVKTPATTSKPTTKKSSTTILTTVKPPTKSTSIKPLVTTTIKTIKKTTTNNIKPTTTTVNPSTTLKPTSKGLSEHVTITSTTKKPSISTIKLSTTTTTTEKPTTTTTTTTTTKKPPPPTTTSTTTKKPPPPRTTTTTTTKKPPPTTTTTTTTTKKPPPPRTTTTKKPPPPPPPPTTTTTTKKPPPPRTTTTTTKKPPLPPPPTTTTTTKKPTTTGTIKPITNFAKINTQNKVSSTTIQPITVTPKQNIVSPIQAQSTTKISTTDSQPRLAEDFALLNTLLQLQNEQSGNSIAPPYSTADLSNEDDDLANRIIQLAIERAQSSTEPSTSSDLQQLGSASTPSVAEVESSSHLMPLDIESSSPGGKISLWVVPNEEAASPKSPQLTPQEEQVLNALLTSQRGSTPASIRDQILLAELLAGVPSTTKRPRKKKKPRTSTTPRPPPFSGLAALISGLGSGNQGQGGGRYTAPSSETDSFDEEQPRNPGLLVTAAINITRAVSQFMGIVLQGAAQSFQNFVQSRTRSLADILTNGSNGG